MFPLPHLLLLSIVFMALPDPAHTGCSFPWKMAGKAAHTNGKFFDFSIDLMSQRAMFRDSKNASIFTYLDYPTHKKYQKFSDGHCIISHLDKTLRLPFGVPSSWDESITSQYPEPPALPRQVRYQRPSGKEFSVWLYSTDKCLPQDWTMFLEAPGTPIATMFVFSDKSKMGGYNINEDLSQCVFD